MNELNYADVPSTFTFKRLFEKEILDEIKNLRNGKGKPVDDIPKK